MSLVLVCFKLKQNKKISIKPQITTSRIIYIIEYHNTRHPGPVHAYFNFAFTPTTRFKVNT